MPTTKFFEIRDRGTCLPVMAIRLDSETCSDKERWLLSQAGFGKTQESHREYIMLCDIASRKPHALYDPFNWKESFMVDVHLHLQDHFDDYQSGAVLDVSVIRGESDTPRPSDYQPEN